MSKLVNRIAKAFERHQPPQDEHIKIHAQEHKSKGREWRFTNLNELDEGPNGILQGSTPTHNNHMICLMRLASVYLLAIFFFFFFHIVVWSMVSSFLFDGFHRNNQDVCFFNDNYNIGKLCYLFIQTAQNRLTRICTSLSVLHALLCFSLSPTD